MDKRAAKYILAITIVLFMFVISYSISNLFKSQNREKTIEVESLEKTKLETFKNMIESSDYFENSNIELNDDKNTVTIDNKYDIYIKNGYYMMNIKDTKLENGYCEIVDIIEQNLGGKPGDSIETCKATLNGSINLGGISAELYDEHKILTVLSDELSLIFSNETSHIEKDLISVDEVNYSINIDNYLFTSMRIDFVKDQKIYNLCGHVYNKKQNAKNEFIFTLYNENKEEIANTTYKYQNDTKQYLSFCANFNLESDNIKYYSIEKK